MSVIGRLVAEQLECEELESRNQRLRAVATGFGALLAALEARDGYAGEHSEAVVGLSKKVGDVEEAARLHDVGKIGVPDSILRKPGLLNEDDWETMREHPIIGERIVASIESLAYLIPLVRAEHERWDSRSYPDGLSGDEVPLASCVILACDAFHAITSDRPYRKAMPPEEALAEIKRNSGTQFCPAVAEALLEIVGKNL